METAVDLYHVIPPELPTALRLTPVLLTLPLTAWPIFLPSLLAASFPHHASDPLASCVSPKGHGSFPHRGMHPDCSLSTLEGPASLCAGWIFLQTAAFVPSPQRSYQVSLIVLS